VPVESRVGEQPTGHDGTVAAAETRARNVLESGGDDLGVGIEGGVATVEGPPGPCLITWAAVIDGERLERGAGRSLRGIRRAQGR
jgi:non-canonical (house-cleaning) NTP pyrophosphatase